MCQLISISQYHVPIRLAPCVSDFTLSFKGAIRWPLVSSSCVHAASSRLCQLPETPRSVAAEEGELLSSCGGTALRLQEAILQAGEDGYGVLLCGALLAYVSRSCALLARDTSVLDW